MPPILRACLFAVLLIAHARAAEPKLELVEVHKIWDAAKHNAFTDLIRFHDQWYCSFRESAAHVGGDGSISIIVSPDGNEWKRAALLSEKEIDLRDPKLSITPDGRLMVVAGGSVYHGGKQILGRMPRVAFSVDGVAWTAPARVLGEWDWLWRVTWNNGHAYGTTYKLPPADAVSKERELRLVTSDDGLKWKDVLTLNVPGQPNETTVRFLRDGTAMALVRREAEDKHAWIGTSAAPYREWKWKDAGEQIGGPNFIELPSGLLIGGGRHYPGGAKLQLGVLSSDGYQPLLTLPSGGDCSYPGLVWHDGLLWVSYYSSHEGKTSIYLAKVKVTGAP